MIQIFLLTGFLGAGKTTLLQRLLKSYEDRKIGVIVNEFGEINVDARMVEKEGIEMAELSNGSIFCACIKDKFVDGLIEMFDRDLEILFIEASGLADPANMGHILDGIRNKTKDIYLLRGSICVVDGENFLKMADVLPALQNQVAYANVVIVNKADLVNEKTISAVSEKINEINSDVYIMTTSYCKVDLREITDNFSTILKESKETSNTYESRPTSFVLKASDPLSHDKLVEFLNEIAPQTFRIKGFAETDKGCEEVNGVVENVILKKWEGTSKGTEIVVISSIGIKMLSIITAASSKYLEGRLKL